MIIGMLALVIVHYMVC